MNNKDKERKETEDHSVDFIPVTNAKKIKVVKVPSIERRF